MSVLTDALQNIVRAPGNPIFGLTPWPAWEGTEHQEIAVVLEGGTYYGFYGAGGTNADGTAWIQIGCITTAEASYPAGWARWGTDGKVLTAGSQPAMDYRNVANPSVVKMQDGSWRLYYNGYAGVGQETRAGVAMATAAGFPGAWTKYASNPIVNLGAGGAWTSAGVRLVDPMPPWVSGDSVWHGLLAGYNGSIWQAGHAQSPDGLAWTVDSSPMLPPQGTWGVGWEAGWTYPFLLVKDGSQYVLVYGGTNASYGSGSYWAMGYATGPSPTGPWTRYAANPIMAGDVGQWDANSVNITSLVQVPDRLDVWYIGSGVNIDYGFNIGRAYAAQAIGADITEGATFAVSHSGSVADAPSSTLAATLAAAQDAAYGPANRLTVSAGPVVDGRVTLSGSRIPGSVVYVST